LAKAVEAGEIHDVTGKRSCVVRPAALRRLAFGLPVQMAAMSAARRVIVPATGIRLVGAVVAATGESLDLRDLAGPDGGPFGPLVLETCHIPSPIQLTGARLRRLSLKGSRIVHLDAAGLLVEGELELSNLASAELAGARTGCHGQGRCWVELRGARIEGSVTAAHATLAAPPGRGDLERGAEPTRYALDLRDGHVRDRMTLMPNFRAYGGIRLREVGSDVRLEGAHLVAEEDDAFDGQDARFGGPLLLRSLSRPHADDEPFVAEGGIWLFGAKISGNFDMSGATLKAKRNAQPSDEVLSLVATNAEVSDSIRLCAHNGRLNGVNHTLPFSAEGSIKLHNLKVGDGASLFGAQLQSNLTLQNVNIDGTLWLCACTGAADGVPANPGFLVKGHLSLLGAKISNDLDMDGAVIEGELDASGAEVGGQARLRPFATEGGRVQGLANFAHIKVRRGLIIQAALGGDLHLDHAEIDDELQLNLTPLSNAAEPVLRLCGAHVGALNDDGGDGVAGFRLNMEGLHYDRLVEHKEKLSPLKERLATFQRRLHRAVPGLWGAAVLMVVVTLPLALLVVEGPPLIGLATLWCVLMAFTAMREWPIATSAAEQRLKWLNRQCHDASSSRAAYRPEPWERLTRYFRSQGLYVEARRIARARLGIERRLKTFALLRPPLAVYGVLFDYGMSPFRALLTFSFCILVGWGGAWLADRGLDPANKPAWASSLPEWRIAPVLVIDASAVTPMAADRKAVFAPNGTTQKPQDELPCDDQIEPLIYALDVFVPALDLRQENRCTITTKPQAIVWRALMALYSILGWIVTSLTLLTISGILRRQVEG